jgi:hypothetical protein
MTDTRPDLLAVLPGLIAARILIKLPALKECRGMVGRLDVETIKRKGFSAPCVLVSRLRATQAETLAGPHRLFTLQMAAFILTKDTLGLGRDEAAATIAQTLLRTIPGNVWGLPDDVTEAEAVTEVPLVSAATEKEGVALTAVTWTQKVALSGLPPGEAITPELYVNGALLVPGGAA